ncbi:MAG TPA: hypothetical protein PKA88_20345, partial [Polyangiaceae bacterium]|nr:hypothetical protein [Polyangiaceae bacterium]
KRSASVWATLLCPLLWLGHRSNVARLRRRRPALLQQNRSIIDAQNSWRLLTSRTTILVATRSETPVRPRGPGSVPGPSERR